MAPRQGPQECGRHFGAGETEKAESPYSSGRGAGRPLSSKRNVNGLLYTAPSWEMRVDLGRKLHFPQAVQTSLRPDAVICSEEAKKIILNELTVPWEDGRIEASEQKIPKYQECRSWLFPFEVSCRGLPAQSVGRAFTVLGMSGSERKMGWAGWAGS